MVSMQVYNVKLPTRFNGPYIWFLGYHHCVLRQFSSLTNDIASSGQHDTLAEPASSTPQNKDADPSALLKSPMDL